MQLLQKLLNKLNGLHYSQEYLCFGKGTFVQPLHVYLVLDGKIIKDITNCHLFVGYCPLVFAFRNDPVLTPFLHVIFSKDVLQLNEFYPAKDAIAELNLQLLKGQPLKEVQLYEGISGSHHFLSAFQQKIMAICNDRYNKKPGNVFLHDNLYKQVQIAYAVPRNISLITVGNNGLFNLFPTDLHGQPGEGHNIISLRIGGKAAEQVVTAGKILLSQVHADAYKMVYGLGKNHMQELRPADDLPLTGKRSKNFDLPVPQHAISGIELELLQYADHGIHRIMLFKIISQSENGDPNDALVHIHNSYATWRFKNGIPGNYLMR